MLKLEEYNCIIFISATVQYSERQHDDVEWGVSCNIMSKRRSMRSRIQDYDQQVRTQENDRVITGNVLFKFEAPMSTYENEKTTTKSIVGGHMEFIKKELHRVNERLNKFGLRLTNLKARCMLELNDNSLSPILMPEDALSGDPETVHYVNGLSGLKLVKYECRDFKRVHGHSDMTENAFSYLTEEVFYNITYEFTVSDFFKSNNTKEIFKFIKMVMDKKGVELTNDSNNDVLIL